MKRMLTSLAAFGVCAAALALGVLLPGWMTRNAEDDDLYQRFSMEPVSLTSQAEEPETDDVDRTAQVLDDMVRYRNAQDFVPLEWLRPDESLYAFWNTLLERLESLGWVHGERSTTSTLAFLRQDDRNYLIGWSISCGYRFSYHFGENTETGWTSVNAHVSEDGALLALELNTDRMALEETVEGTPSISTFGMTPAEAAQELGKLIAELNGLPVPVILRDNAVAYEQTFRLRFTPEGGDPVQFTLLTGNDLLIFTS